jgi:hypothetical protein
VSQILFLRFYKSLDEDLIWVIEEYKSSGKILAAFYSTSIALIPKFDNPTIFYEFRPI